MEEINNHKDLHSSMECFWLNKFYGERSKSYFPYDFKKDGASHILEEKRFRFTGELFSQLIKLCNQSDPRLHMILVSGIITLLNRYTGNNDITVAVPVYKQEKQGEFINTSLALRNIVNPAASFKDLLLQVRQSILEAVENQNYPIELLVQQLKNLASGKDSSLFDMAVLLKNIHEKEYIQHLNLDMFFIFNRTDESLEGILEYNPGLYLETSIERIIHHFTHLVGEAVFQVNTRICDLEMLSREEMQQLLFDFNNTAIEYPKHKTLHGSFAEQVERTPDNIAVVETHQLHELHEEGTRGPAPLPGLMSITYKELNRKSNQLAHLLMQKGIEPDTIVAIMMERSIEMIIGILGILKAGAAYLPIDPDYPEERVDYMLKDSSAKLLLASPETQVKVKAEVEERCGQTQELPLQFINIETHIASTVESSLSTLTSTSTCQVSPANLAYIIYTSGSAGKPKGTLIRHINVSNYTTWFKKEFEITVKDRFGFVGSFCFDMSVTSIIVPLLTGASSCTVRDKIEHNPQRCTRYLAKNKISIIKLTPSRFRRLLDFIREEDLGALRYIILGGEAVDGDDVRKYLACYPHQRIVNEYGSPGATMAALFYIVHGDTCKQENETASDSTKIDIPVKGKTQDWNNVPIGKPIFNTRVYILDKYLKVLPIGVVGELFIGGIGVSMGYLNNPELTFEKFEIPKDSQYHRSHRSYRSYIIYKTGDLARWLSDGNIEFLGRIDHQLTIKGSRIESGEIQSRLKAHDYVSDAVVIAREDGRGDKYLCAYFVGVSGTEKETAPSKLREFLGKKLPDNMIPSYFVRLEEIPLTPKGKVDRAILPEPREGSTGLKNRYISPQTEKERLLSEIWGEILEKERVGLYDNFFDLGGHSLHAISVITQVYKEFGTRIPLSTIFSRPTISELAEVLGKARGESLPDIQKCTENDYYPLSHAQMRLWFFTQMEPTNPAYNVSGIIRIRGDFDLQIFKETLAIIAGRHEALRTSVTVVEKDTEKGKEEIAVQIIHDTVEIDIQRMDISNFPEGEKEEILLRIIEEEGKRPFDLAQAPLFRATSIQLGPQHCLLVFIMHHIISDNWSSKQIIEEFTYFYDRLKKNLPANLPPLAFHYKEFAYWQNRILSENLLNGQREYWHKKLGGQLPVLDLRTDYPRPSIQSSRGDQVTIEIDTQLTQRLKKLAREKVSTLFMILTAAFKVLLYRYTNQEDILVGTLIAGRSTSDLEKIIGYFVNILALRDTVTGHMTFDDFLGHVKRTMLESYDNQDYPFDVLVDELKVERNPGRSPVFDILLVYQNTEELRLESSSSLKSLKFSAFERNYVVSKYDIYLDIFNFPDNIRINVEFCVDLYKKETIRQMSRHYQNILDSLSLSPGQLVSKIDMISQLEKNKLLIDFNGTSRDISRQQCYHNLFRHLVAMNPGRIAAKHKDIIITYKELNEQANRIAHNLIEHRVQPDTMVALYLRRSIYMLAAIIGIFKSGAAYLPIETDYPAERIGYMIRDAEVRLILTEQENVQKLDEIIGDSYSPFPGRILCLDSENEHAPVFMTASGDGMDKAESLPKDNPFNRSTPGNYAYLIYTSGTAGKPKGALIHQLGMINHLYAKIHDLAINENDRIAQTASQCFDISVWQFLAGLLRGAATVIFDYEVVLNPEALLRKLRQEKITIFESVPSLMTVFLEMLENIEDKKLKDLRWMILTGEALKPFLVSQWFRHYPGIKLVNAYGPTEASDDITHYVIESGDNCERSGIPIGKPVQNMCIYILNKDLSLCPIGVRGEICVAGLGVGKGYWREPEKTKQAFIPNPYARGGSNQDYATLYKTGDIGYYHDDGNIECLGRIDNQVKVRGFRIELEEIETVMNQHPALSECAVVIKKKEGDTNFIVGFLVQREPIDINELKRFLLDYLPNYMIPSAFVKLDKLPLAISGKVDRRALTAMDIDTLSSTTDSAIEFVSPHNDTQKKIAEIWTKTLGIDNIGIYDNFFDIGGHSLLIPRIHRKINKQFPLKCQIADLFEYMTIYELARHIDGTLETAEEDEILEITID